MWIVIGVFGIGLFLLGLYVGSRRRESDHGREARFESYGAEPAETEEERDSWEGGFWDASEPRDLATTLEIEYRDAAGSKTRRVVHTRSYDDRSDGLLIGHCALRNATRTFRFDRILSAVDVATGEAITDLRSHLDVLYESSPERALDALAERHRELLKVLLFVAKADGQYRREEKVIVREFFRELATDPRVTDDMIDKVFADLAVPSLQSFKVAVGKVLDQQLCSPRELNQVCSAIVDTQGSRTAGEIEALDYISHRTERCERGTGSAA